MNPLHTEFTRLYVAEPQHALLHDATRSPLQDAGGQVRCAVLELARPADWGLLGTVWRGAQADLKLPAPAIAINGLDAYQLWFAWQQPVPAANTARFVQLLCQRYLGAVPAPRLRCWPAQDTGTPTDDSNFPGWVPAPHPRSGQWSAFIAPDLAAVFADEPWLDRDPGVEAQAQLLGRLEGMGPAAFAQAMEQLQPLPTAAAVPDSPTSPHLEDLIAPTAYPANSPAAFLEAVMQDARTPLALRVQAAVALLAHGTLPPRA